MGGWGMSQKCETFKPSALWVLLPVLTLSNCCSIDCLCAKYRFITNKGLTISRRRGIQVHAFRVTHGLRCCWALIPQKCICWLLTYAEHHTSEKAHYLISDMGQSKPWWKIFNICINSVQLNINWWHWDRSHPYHHLCCLINHCVLSFYFIGGTEDNLKDLIYG